MMCWQVHEMFLDQRSLLAPIKITQQLLKLLQQHLTADNQQQQQQQQLTQGLDAHAAATAAAAASAVADAKAAAANGSSSGSNDGSSGGSNDGSGGSNDGSSGSNDVSSGSNADKDGITWRQVYLGSSASSICSGMTAGQLRHFFHEAALCIRSYDPHQGSVSLRLPAYLTPQHS
jgi:hypothetical protein